MEENKMNEKIQNEPINTNNLNTNQNYSLNEKINPYDIIDKKNKVKKNLKDCFTLLLAVFSIILISVTVYTILYTVHGFKTHGGIMILVLIIIGIFAAYIIKISSKIIYYAKQGYNQIEEETETAGVTGLCIGISLIVLSLFIYYAIKKIFLLLFTLIGIITIINSIKYLIYIKK